MLSCGNKRSHMAFDALQIVPCNYVDCRFKWKEHRGYTYRAHRENQLSFNVLSLTQKATHGQMHQVSLP